MHVRAWEHNPNSANYTRASHYELHYDTIHLPVHVHVQVHIHVCTYYNIHVCTLCMYMYM
jgi:hypothetical protein